MKKRKIQMNLLYLPALFIVLLFVLYPLIRSIITSFYSWNGYSDYRTFVGLQNYKNMFTDSHFRRSFFNTIIYGFGTTVLANLFGLGLAIFLNTKFAGHKIVRTIVYLPVLISGLILGYIMYFIVRNNGALNEILGWFGLQGMDWMGNGNIGLLIITLINSWQICGYSMVIYMAGLQGISQQYYDAASIDGANSSQLLRYVTMPLLLPAMSSSVVVILIGGLKIYDMVVSLSGGGPNFMTSSLSYYLNNRYFEAEQAGYASAVGVFMFFFIMICAMIVNSYFRRRRVDM